MTERLTVEQVSRDLVMKRCSNCWEAKPATPEFFHRHASKPDGLQYRCKVCRNAHDRAHNRMWPGMKARHRRQYRLSNRVIRMAAAEVGRPFVPKATEKRCPRCQEVKPLTREYFYRNLGRGNGFDSWCKPCCKAAKARAKVAHS